MVRTALSTCQVWWRSAAARAREEKMGVFVCLLFCFYRASICEGGLGSRNSVLLSVCLSVCLSVARVDCDKSKWCTADMLIPHERAITLLL